MDIDLIRDYIVDHKEQLESQPEKLRILKRHVQIEKSYDAVLGSDPKLCQAFIRIDRVFPGEPVPLFGQDVPSMAHNRISIWLGADDPETGARVPGKPLLTCLLSEESMSNLMFNQNRGETKTWLTAETALGWALGPCQAKTHPAAELRTMDRIDETADASIRGLQATTDKIRKAKLPWTKSFHEDMGRRFDPQRDVSDFSFHLKLHLEAEQQRQVQTQVQAAHMALHMSSVLAAREQLLLAPPEKIERGPAEFDAERQHNPMLQTLMERIEDDEREVLLEVLHHAMQKFHTKIGRAFSPDSVPNEKTMRSLLGYTDRDSKLSDEWAHLYELYQELTNEHRREARKHRTPWMLTAGLSAVSGWSEGLHSDFSRLGSHYHTLTISVAQEHDDYGTKRLRSLKEILSIELTSEDLMTAFRGHPSGDFTRCTLRHLFGTMVPRASYSNRFDKTVSEATAMKDTGVDDEVKSLVRKVRTRIHVGIRTAADRDQLLVDLEALQSAHREMIVDRAAKSREAATEISNMVQDDIRQALTGVLSQIAIDRDDPIDLLGMAP